METVRQTYSIDQIKGMLLDRIESVLAQYAPATVGAYRDKGKYFTLNPGRVDRSVGSFVVYLNSGRWQDFASGERGDLIDLIRLRLGISPGEALAEARSFLGLQNETPEQKAKREEAEAKAKERRKQSEAAAAAQVERERSWAQALWLSGQHIPGTPVEQYLLGRGIDLRSLGFAPGSLRYHPECQFRHTEVDPETGEVFEVKLKLPAMLAAMVDGRGKFVACHRTYLQRGARGGWEKAHIPNPRDPSLKPLKVKKVFGQKCDGTSIRISSGTGPRGGKAARLSECPPGTVVYVAEGIENALSAVILKPGIRALAAYSLSNLGSLELPANVAEVVLITDHDTNDDARRALARAIAAHQKAGRRVRTWTSDVPGEDMNDALMRALRAEAAEAEEQGAA